MRFEVLQFIILSCAIWIVLYQNAVKCNVIQLSVQKHCIVRGKVQRTVGGVVCCNSKSSHDQSNRCDVVRGDCNWMV